MHAILATLGTDGDVFPHIGLGVRLRARGHQVTLAAPEPHRDLAADLGLGFRPWRRPRRPAGCWPTRTSGTRCEAGR